MLARRAGLAARMIRLLLRASASTDMPAPDTGMPQPTFVLPEPLRLLVRGNRPIYQGELQLLAGPQRVEGGWWDRVEGAGATRNVVRDYWVALSAKAGVLWIFQTRLEETPAWYLHGHFA